MHFITQHLNLSSLTVRRCSFEFIDEPCPFSNLDRNYHSSIISLSSPMFCVIHLLDSNLITLLDLSWSSGSYIPLFLERAGFCSQTIVQLDLEYLVKYPKLLNSIGKLLPELYSLQLWEKAEVRITSCYFEQSWQLSGKPFLRILLNFLERAIWHGDQNYYLFGSCGCLSSQPRMGWPFYLTSMVVNTFMSINCLSARSSQNLLWHSHCIKVWVFLFINT